MSHHTRQVDHALIRAVAAEYERLPHEPTSRDVQLAYRAFAGEIAEQLRRIRVHGVRIVPTVDDPYASSAALFADIRENRTLRVYAVAELPEGHPGLWPIDETGLSLNVAFRAVHDYFGHYIAGNSFSLRGEYRAFLAHAASFRRFDSVRVVATETMGQNAWFHVGPRSHERPYVYAPQKATLLCDESVNALLGGQR